MLPFRKKKKQELPRRRTVDYDRRERASEIDAERNNLFRRNRTLTGSVSARVASATETSGDLQSPRAQMHHLTMQRRKIGIVFGAVLTAAAVLFGLIYSLTVTPIVTSDEALGLDVKRYSKAIDEYLARYPVERLRPLLNEAKLQDYLHQILPEVKSVRQQGLSRLGETNFIMTMRRPIASWVLTGKQYFVDGEGIPFERNYYETPVVSVVDQSGIQQTPGTAVASSRFLAFVGRVVSEAGKYNLVVEQAVIPAGTTRQLEVKVQGRGYPIKLSLDRPAGEQVEDMKNALGYFDVRQAPQYVDVRVSGRAYYR